MEKTETVNPQISFVSELTLLKEMLPKEEALEMLKEKISEWRAIRDKIAEELRPILEKIAAIPDEFSKWFWRQSLEIIYLPEEYKQAVANLARLRRLRALLNSPSKAKKVANWECAVATARQTPILSLYSFQRLRRTGSRSTALCPFHNEKTPSFTLYPDGSFHCFACGAHGRDSIDFFKLLNGVDFKQAVEALSGVEGR